MSVTIKITEDPLRIADWQRHLDDVDSGAHTWFEGVTRRKTNGPDGKTLVTQTLHYQAHPTMAQSQMQRLADQARADFSLLHVVLVHRIGEVPLGEASVLLGCSSAHRKDCFAAIVWIMDRLKQDVPIWKRETFDDRTTQWIHPESEGQ